MKKIEWSLIPKLLSFKMVSSSASMKMDLIVKFWSFLVNFFGQILVKFCGHFWSFLVISGQFFWSIFLVNFSGHFLPILWSNFGHFWSNFVVIFGQFFWSFFGHCLVKLLLKILGHYLVKIKHKSSGFRPNFSKLIIYP